MASRAKRFGPLVPNKKSIAAMKAARRGNLKSFGSVAALMADLNAVGEQRFVESTHTVPK